MMRCLTESAVRPTNVTVGFEGIFPNCTSDDLTFLKDAWAGNRMV